jgi:AcrR family transcriptional regulator
MSPPARDAAHPAPAPAPPAVPGAGLPTGLRRDDRRAALVDAAADLVRRGGPAAASMEAVAAEVGVSRALVYKHFGNRHELLAEVYRREAARLDAEIVAAVEAADGFAEKVRALVGAALRAEAERGPVFASLHEAGARDETLRGEQRSRNRRTVRFFSDLATTELGVPPRQARAATAVLLTGLDSVRAQWRADPTAARRRFLEDLYVRLVTGGLRELAPPD